VDFLKIVPICSDSYGANTYLLASCEEAFIVDPTVSVGAMLRAVEKENAVLKGILLTHGHFDHLFSLDPLRKDTGVCAYIHQNDAIMLTDGKKNAFFDFFGKERTYAPAEHLLLGGELLSLGNEKIEVIHTPGHTQGSVCYRCGDILVTGDTLFANTYGRCDLYGGDMSALARSLASLRELNQNLTIYPGHGGTATLGSALDNLFGLT
jgi:glyoxylase-like metal-dependent hydrolase (beta-lactamase superfamily II)